MAAGFATITILRKDDLLAQDVTPKTKTNTTIQRQNGVWGLKTKTIYLLKTFTTLVL